MKQSDKIEIQCIRTKEKKYVKPTSKGFKRTSAGDVFWHCLYREACTDVIGCHGQIFVTPEEKVKFTIEILNNMPKH